MEDNSYYGVLEERYDDRDWLASDIEIPRAPRGTNSFLLNGATQYNQKDVDNVSCTIHGAMGAYSDLTGYKFTLDERKALWSEALKRGALPNVGWYISSAVKLVAEWVSKNLKQKVTYHRLDVRSYEFGMVMRLGYSPVVGYRGSKLYNTDRNEDGILDLIKLQHTTYGHCIRTSYSIGDEYDRMIDNYPYKNVNLYLLPTVNWKKLVNNGVFFRSAYIYLLK